MSFEVERFEWISDERLEVSGHWFGVRGRRFLRPSLDIDVGGEQHRMLAVLDHKPWAADDGEEWVAAFSWKGDPVDVSAAELAVGPDLAVTLPQPGSTGRRRKRITRSSGPRQAGRKPRTAQLESALADARTEAKQARDELEQARAAHEEEAGELRRRFTAEQKTAAGLAAELKQAREAIAAAEAAGEARVAEVQRERDTAVAARAVAEERAGRVEQELVAAERARDDARAERNAWLSRARTAVSERDEAVTARANAVAERDAARAERDAALAARDNATGERDAAERALAKRMTAEREAIARAERAAGAVPPRAAGAVAPDAAAEQPALPADAAPPSGGPASPARTSRGERRTVVIPAEPEVDRSTALAQARTALLDTSPPPEPEFRDVWGPRLIAIAALLVLIAIVVVLVVL